MNSQLLETQVKPTIASMYHIEKVSFKSAGETLAGQYFTPPSSVQHKKETIVILGPFGFVKEQAPQEYASRLVREGYSILIFDPRYSGESSGEPRRFESPSAKIADVKAALDYLKKCPELSDNPVWLLGICQGSSEMIAAAAQDTRVKGLITVSGQYLYRDNIAQFFSHGGPGLDERIARGHAAKEKYEKTGVVDYNPVISSTRQDVALPFPPIYDWYHPWETEKWGEKTRWENRYATMSDAEVWNFDVLKYASQVQVPTLVVHGEKSDGGVEAAQHVYEALPGKDKKLVILDGIFHTRFYDDPLIVDQATGSIVSWLQAHAAAAHQ